MIWRDYNWLIIDYNRFFLAFVETVKISPYNFNMPRQIKMTYFAIWLQHKYNKIIKFWKNEMIKT